MGVILSAIEESPGFNISKEWLMSRVNVNKTRLKSKYDILV